MYRIPVYTVSLVREHSQAAETKVITSPLEAYHLLNTYIGEADREHFVVLLLDTRNVVRGIHTVSIGSLNASCVHPREVFKAAILTNAAAVIVGHNHPSGNPIPSHEDIALTERLVQAGELLGIPVLDHLVLGDQAYISLQERGLIHK